MPASLDHKKRMLKHLEGQEPPRERDIAEFILAAIKAHTAHSRIAGIAIKNADILDDRFVRLHLDDRSFVEVEFTHMVPRDYYRTEDH